MDPVSAAISLVVPVLAKKGAELAAKVGEDVWDAVSKKALGIWEAIKRRFSGDEKGEAAIKDLEERPEDPGSQKAARDIVAAADEEFLETLSELVEQAIQAGGDEVIKAGRDATRVEGSGHVTATGGSVAAGYGSNAAGGDQEITIGATPPKDE
jgi:hypothetical protein